MLPYDPYEALTELREFAPMQLTSTDFQAGEALPESAWASARGGADLSPQLSWSGAPAGTKSFSVSCFDPDAPTGSGYWHWAIFDIPADVTDLVAGAGDPESDSLPAGTRVLPNEAGSLQFVGAAPPPGTGTHRYFFVVDALDVDKLDIPDGSTPAILGFNRHFHTLARGVLIGLATP